MNPTGLIYDSEVVRMLMRLAERLIVHARLGKSGDFWTQLLLLAFGLVILVHVELRLVGWQCSC